MRVVVAAVSFLVCLAAAAAALWFLLVVIGGAIGDARLLAGVSGWLLMIYPAYWAAAWAAGHWFD